MYALALSASVTISVATNPISSLESIDIVADELVKVVLVGLERVKRKFSLFSERLSFVMGIIIVAVFAFSSKVNTPLADV